MDVRFQVQTEVLRPVADVFDAVVNPAKLSGYFTSTASGPLVKGHTVLWRFPEFSDDVTVPVTVDEVVPNRRLLLKWMGGEHYETHVEMTFELLDDHSTLVSIIEWGWHSDDDGIQAAQGNCMGWTHMSTCLKSYLEFGINLRRGSFSAELIGKHRGLRKS